MARVTTASLMAAIANLQARVEATTVAPAAVAVPAFLQPAPNAVPLREPAHLTRTWKRTGEGESKAGNPFTIFQSATRNGGTFPVRIPSDLLAAIRQGKV